MTTRTPSSGWLSRLAQGSLVKQILIGLVLGVLLALVSKPRLSPSVCWGPCSSAR
ncbi:hypothetical protein BANRA_05308 [Klebsiella pneumoniae]|uniref:hypothetical protein n=1 Tax=Klebsiella pneumoniae TaxID=573 RepID=UPI000F296A8F|nr:hypothetical protein [Klebsiella pneumoniae]VDA26778.1 hypothetical protein BANRA_05308 [Klebsiella pneumoniae]